VDEHVKPIRIFGVTLIALALLGVLFFGNLFLNPNSEIYVLGPNPPSGLHIYFVVGSLLFYFTVGLGIVLLTRWGYVLFKGFLYLLLLGFPIGTFVSYKTLSYMKRHNIKQYFGFSPSEH